MFEGMDNKLAGMMIFLAHQNRVDGLEALVKSEQKMIIGHLQGEIRNQKCPSSIQLIHDIDILRRNDTNKRAAQNRKIEGRTFSGDVHKS